MEDQKLLQESNLTARQPCRACITLYISFNKRRLLANEGLVNLTGIWDANLDSLSHPPVCYPLLYWPPYIHTLLQMWDLYNHRDPIIIRSLTATIDVRNVENTMFYEKNKKPW